MIKSLSNIGILGFGREGISLLTYLRRRRLNPVKITILDKNPVTLPPGLKNIGIVTGVEYLKNLQQFDVVYRSPGIPYSLPEIQEAIKHGVQFSSATKLFFEEIKKTKAKVIGVTGTKGKGTTLTLIYEILKKSGFTAVVAGNIGAPMLDVLPQAKKADFVVLELSSFQLQDLTISPDVAVVLDITPDHLDAHKDFSEYVAAKSGIASYQDRSDSVFYFSGNSYAQRIAQKSAGTSIIVEPDKFTLFTPEDLKVPGYHNFKNAVMAATVCQSLGAPDLIIKKVITQFKGLPMRLEFIKTIRRARGIEIKFYNDSAGTNPETAAAAARAFTTPSILIAGGKDKNLDYAGLKAALLTSSVFQVVLFGENKLKIQSQLKSIAQPIAITGDLSPTVEYAFRLAKEYIAKTNTSVNILFSPASASFDMFKSYVDRGLEFNAIVKKLKI